MKAFLTLTLLIIITLPQLTQSQGVVTDSFTVDRVGLKWTLQARLRDINPIDTSIGFFRGANYVARGLLYPGNYFEENCPDTWACGLVLDTIINGNDTSYQLLEMDTTIVIGEWDCKGFVNDGFNSGVLEGDETEMFDQSTQIFIFYAHPLSPCPEGCYIVTEGVAGYRDTLNSKPAVRRTIAGGTKDFKYMKGEVQYNEIKDEGLEEVLNASGGTGVRFTFYYTLMEEEENYQRQLNVSAKRQTLHLLNPNFTFHPYKLPVDSLVEQYAAIMSLEGVIYEGGTFAPGNLNSGIDANGNAEWDSIGRWTSRGWWASDDHNLDDGFYFVNKQTFEFEDPIKGHLLIETDGKDWASMNVPITRAVIGATDELFGHRGDCIQEIIGKNASGGWNFTYSFQTGLATDLAKVPQKIPVILMELFPNPVTHKLTVVLKNLDAKGRYVAEVVDATGNLLYQKHIESVPDYFQTEVDVSNFPAGWYTLVLKKDGMVVGSNGFTKME